MKKIFLALTLLFIGFLTIQCKPETEEKQNGNLIVKLVVTADKDYAATFDGTTVTFSEQLPYGTTEVTIKSLEISSKATVNKSVGDKIPVGTAFTIVVTAENGDTKNYTLTLTTKPVSTGKNITAMIITANDTNFTGTISGTNIAFPALPFGTTQASIKSLTVSANATTDKNVNDAVSVTGDSIVVTAQDNSTQTYTLAISVAPATTGNSITAIVITANDTDYRGTISGTNITFSALPFGTTQASIKSLTVSANATTDKNVNDAVSVTGDSIVVTAQDKSTQTYTLDISVTSATTGKDITAIVITANSVDYSGTITGTTVTFPELPNGTTQVTLKTLTISPNATANKTEGATLGVSGESITVTAQDNSTQTYTLTILVEPPHFNIPDDNFRNAIIASSDVNNSDVSGTSIRQDALERVTNLNANSQNITTISGVGYMTSLTFLSVYNNSLNAIDVSTNTNLTYLSVYNNSLTTLDVSINTSLTYLFINSNSLTDLDISTNTSLTSLRVQYNSLTTLNVSTNTELAYLTIFYNSLTALDVSTNTDLISLVVDTNSITYLDISTNTRLNSLIAHTNSLTSLDVSTNTNIKYLDIRGNSSLTCIQTLSSYTINTVKKDGSQNLSTDCSPSSEKDITAIVITANSVDYTGTITGTTITFPELPTGTTQASIKSLTVSANATTDKNVNDAVSVTGDSITVTAQDNSTQTYTLDINVTPPFINIPDTNFRNAIVSCINNGHTRVSGNSNGYGCTSNYNGTAVVSGNGIRRDVLESITVLKYNNFFPNHLNNAIRINSISGVEYMTSLIHLDISINNLTSFDVNDGLNSLTYLGVSNNNGQTLTYINTSNIPMLKQLRTDYNSLSSLDLSNNSSLTALYVTYNDLTTLDLSSNLSLNNLSVNNNDITTLDLSNNTSLNYVNVGSNSSLTCIITSSGQSFILFQKDPGQQTSNGAENCN